MIFPSPFFKNTKRFIFFTFFVFLALFIIVFPDVVFYGATFAKRDIVRFYFPVWKFTVQMMKSGVVPLWNPYNSYGTPFLADIQTCVFYPLTLILYLPNYLWAFNFYILLHLALAGTFCALWMKDCGASTEASFLSGLAFCLNGYVMSAISLTISLASLVYFPLVLLTLRRSLRSGSFFWKGVSAIVLLVQYLGGDPAIFFATLVVATLFVIYRSLAEFFVRRKIYLKYSLDFLKIIAVFLGLSAFHTLLFHEFLNHSNRTLMGHNEVTVWSMQYNDLLALFFPYFSDISLIFMSYWVRQSWLDNAYAGVVVFLLAFAAFKGVRKNNLIGYHVLLALFGISLSLGCFCSVYDILYYYFPFFKYIRYPARFLFLFSFAMACLAGFGLDEILSRRTPTERSASVSFKTVAMAFLIVFLTALVILLIVFSPQIESTAFEKVHAFFSSWAHMKLDQNTVVDIAIPVLVNLKRMMIFICLFFLGIFASWNFNVRKFLLAFFFTLIVFLDLIDVNVIEVKISGKTLQAPSKNLTRVLQDTEIFRLLASPESVKLQYEPPGAATLELTLGALKETLTPNLLLPYRVADVAGYDSIFLRESLDINGRRRSIKDPTQHRFFDMLNIKYMVSPNEKIGKSYRLVQKAYPTNLFLNERVLPRAYLVLKGQVLTNNEEILDKITAKTYDPEKLIYIDAQGPAFLEHSSEASSAVKSGVTIDTYTPNRVHMKVNSDKAQWLFFSDSFYPGWKAILDGKAVKIYRANYAFRAIPVTPGSHNLEWKYDPILFKIGLMITTLTALGLVIYYVRKRKRVIHL